MEVGQLFFSLGFKSQGISAAEKFETVQSKLAETSSMLVDVFDQIAFTLEKVALKMNAVTQEELEQFKQTQKSKESVEQLGEAYKEFADGQHKLAKETNQTKSIYTLLTDKLDGSIGKFNRVKLQILSVAGAMTALSRKAADYANQLVRFTQVTGLSTEKLQALQRQAAAVGIEGEQVADTIKELQQTAVDIQLGKGNKEAWQWLGLRPGQDPFKQLDILQARMKTLSRPVFVNLAKSAGFSEDMIALLLELKEMPPVEKNMIMSDREIKDLRAFSIQFNKALDGFQIALKKIGVLLLPFTKQFVYIFDRWGWAIRTLTDKFNALSEKTRAWMNILLLIATVVAIKFFPLTAILTGLVLLVDDFLVYMSGGKSLIGRFIEGAKALFQGLSTIIIDFFDMINEKIKGIPFVGKIMDIMNKMNPYALDKNQQPANSNNQTPYMQQMAAGMTTNNLNQNIVINIPGVDDPKKFADEVNKALKSQNTNGYFQNGNTGR
jgi:hypothetical protein